MITDPADPKIINEERADQYGRQDLADGLDTGDRYELFTVVEE